MTLPGFPRVSSSSAKDTRVARLHLGLPGRRPGRPLLPVALQARLRRRRRDGEGRAARTATWSRASRRTPRSAASRAGASRSMRLAAEIGRRANLPLYIHFGQLWPLARRRATASTPTPSSPRSCRCCKPGDILAHPFTRHPGGFVNRDGKVHPIVQRGAGAGAQDRRRPRLAFQLQDGAHRARCRHRARHAGRRHARLQHARCPSRRGTPEAHPDKDQMFFGRTRFSLVSAMTGDARARPAARAGGADGDQQLRRDARHGRARSARSRRASRPTSRVLDDERGRWVLQDNEGHAGARRAHAAPRLLPARRQALRCRRVDPAAAAG